MDINTILKSFGLESAPATRRGAAQKPAEMTDIGMSGWGVESEKAVLSLIKSNLSPIVDGGVLDAQSRVKASANIVHAGLEKLVKRFATESTIYATLPTEIKSFAEIPAKEYFSLKNSLSGITDKQEKFKAKYKMNQAKAALESCLWNVLSGCYTTDLYKRQTNGRLLSGDSLYSKMGQILAPSGATYEGLESTAVATYVDQIYIPKISAFNSWYNIASVIMPKVQKTKTVLNEICEIPVSTKIMVAYEKDKDNKIVKTYKREDLYSKMDMSEIAPNLDRMRTRVLKVAATEMNTAAELDLHMTNFVNHGNKPFLEPNEHIGPQINLIGVTLADASTGANEKVIDETIGDSRSGVSQGPILGQLDTKGKIKHWIPDASKPEEIYHIMLDWDIQYDRLWVSYTKSKPAMQDIKEFRFEFNMRDIEQTLKTRVAFAIKEERTTLKTPEIDRYALPIMPEEMDYLADRGSANHLNKLVEMTSEFTQHKKESRWIKEYRKMKENLKVARYGASGQEDNSKMLYESSVIALNTLEEVRKPESIAYHLGNNLGVMKDAYAKDANSTKGVQLSMFTGTLSLWVIDQCLTHITGEVDEDSDAKFLGVSQNDRVRALTVGNDKNNPIQSIIVGTDKTDFNTKARTEDGTEIPTSQLEYKFEIIPTYADENIHTTLFIEQPTKVISGSEVRANESPLIPSMIIHEGYKYNVIRPAAGDLTITGVGFRAAGNK